MNKEVYEMVGDEEELKWFFDNVIQKPKVNESYSMVFVSRHKKLTQEEKESLGMSNRETEFLSTQSLRLAKFHNANSIDEENNWTFKKFLQHVKRFEVNKEAYLTTGGQPLPEKSLVIIFYVNPCDDIKVADEVIRKIEETKTAIVKAMLNGKDLNTNLQSYQVFGNLESTVKHLKANCKGSNFWLDYDIDVPKWFKDGSEFVNDNDYTEEVDYYDKLKNVFTKYYGKGNYVIIDTSGGYHVLVKCKEIRFDPHKLCKEIEDIYKYGVEVFDEEEYLDEKGNCKFECIVNDSQIPGLPLPGTYQYGRLVRVLNKGDFKQYEVK